MAFLFTLTADEMVRTHRLDTNHSSNSSPTSGVSLAAAALLTSGIGSILSEG